MEAIHERQRSATSMSDAEASQLATLFDLEQIGPLLRSFSNATGIASALILPDGQVLIDANWRRVCTDFHRLHPESGQLCRRSDTMLANEVVNTEGASTYTCLNGLTDAAAPVVVGGRHIANAFVGQFFIEEPDLERFCAQAARFGFDETEYLAAIAEVPVLPIEKVRAAVDFLASTTTLLAGMGYEVLRKDAAERRLQRTLDRLNRSVDAAVGALAHTVEMRDPYTAGHQQRVARLAVAIGKRLKLPSKGITSLRIAGQIHDLGKMAIPAEILAKPGALRDSERMLLREHPETAYEILHEMKFPGPVARIIRDHHERLDGSGYPRGLTGDEIRVESRILAVADVVEAMSAHRPYRPALGIEAALAEISADRERLYDGAAVDACVALFHEEGFKLDSELRQKPRIPVSVVA